MNTGVETREQPKKIEKIDQARQDAQEYVGLEQRLDRLDEDLERNLDYEDGGHFGFRNHEGPQPTREIHREMQNVQKQMDELLSGRDGERVGQYVWLESLLEYRRGRLTQEFVPLPSQRKLIRERLRPAIIKGGKLLLISDTGTGKTSIIEYLGRQLYGREIEYYGAGGSVNLQVPVFGGKGMSVSASGEGGDVFRPGPLTRSLEEPGNLFMLDELDRVETDNADMSLKRVYKAHRGSVIDIPGRLDNQKQMIIPPQFAFVVAINGRKEKRHEEDETGNKRQRFVIGDTVYRSKGVDPAVANQFTNVALTYPPAQEMYDLALSLFIDEKGGIADLTLDDASKVLHNLTNAISEIQDAFSEGIIEGLAFHVGNLLELFNNWKRARLNGVPFVLYLERRLIEEIDGFATSTIGDKLKAIEILARHGLLPTAGQGPEAPYFSSRELRKSADAANLIKNRQTSGQVFYTAAEDNYITPEQVIENLCPVGTRKKRRGQSGGQVEIQRGVGQRGRRQEIERGVPVAVTETVQSLSVDRTLRRDVRWLNVSIGGTRFVRNLPPVISYLFPYGRDIFIPAMQVYRGRGKILNTIGVIWDVPTGIFVNFPSWIPTAIHRRFFKRALNKRENRFIKTLRNHQGQYPIDIWLQAAKAAYSLRDLGRRAFRKTIDTRYQYESDEREKWAWEMDSKIETMLIDRMPIPTNAHEIDVMWKVVFAQTLIRRRPKGMVGFQTKLLNNVCDLFLHSPDLSVRRIAADRLSWFDQNYHEAFVEDVGQAKVDQVRKELYK